MPILAVRDTYRNLIVVLTASRGADYCAESMSTDRSVSPPAAAVSPAESSAGRGDLPPPPLKFAEEGPVIFFDGVCGLCSAWIDFVMSRDKAHIFRFGPLQGSTARDWLQLSDDALFDSVALFDATGIHRKSDAVWRILTRLGGCWRLCGTLLRLVPAPIRNWGYDVIARRRYFWFGKKAACRLPTPAERARFVP